MRFTEIVFDKKEFGGGLISQVPLRNGMILSIVAGKTTYSSPREDLETVDQYSSFEIAIIDSDGEFVTGKFIDGEDCAVKGWVNREEIEKIIEKLS